VVGKWLGSLLFVLTILAITLVYPLILQGLVEPGIDQGVMMTAYLGTILVASAFLGMGVGISALFTNQIAAFFVTLVTFMFFWWLVGIPTQIMQPSTGMDILRYLDMQGHFYDSFNSGRIRLDDIVYFISLTALGLFTGTIAVEVRRWR
jgi:ABC-2 type transport system permease protein